MNMPTTILSSEGLIENTYSWDGSKRRRRVLDQYQQLQMFISLKKYPTFQSKSIPLSH
jgi:hypothetical protein